MKDVLRSLFGKTGRKCPSFFNRCPSYRTDILHVCASKFFATEPDKVRQLFRFHTTMKQKFSPVQQRDLFRQQLEALKALVPMASHKKAGAGVSSKHHVGSCVLSSDTSRKAA